MVDQRDLRPVLVRMLEGRVGSTLVMQLLGTAPDVLFDRVYPFENSYLTYLTRLVGRISTPPLPGANMVEFLYGDPASVGPLPFRAEGLAVDDIARDSLRAVWHAFSKGMHAAATGPARLYAEKYWGEVTPIVDAGLDPIVLDLVRDPRDIVASVRAFNAKTGRELFGRAQAKDDRGHLRRMVAGMRFRLQEFENPLPVTRLVIRYEDLVSDTAGQAARLEDVLGVSLAVTKVNEARPDMAHHMTSSSPESSVGRWARDLPEADIEAVERILGPSMVALGYKLTTQHEHV